MYAKILNKAAGACRFVRNYGQHLPLAGEAVFSYRCTLKRLEVTLKDRAESLSVVYVGRGMNYEWLMHTLFAGRRELESVESTLWSCRSVLEGMAGEADVVIADIGWPYHGAFDRRRRYAAVPDWVNMTVVFPEDWEGVVRNFRRTARRHDLRLIRRNGYRCERVRDRRAIERFYDDMYVPFVRQRFSDASAVAPRGHVIRRALQGYLLQVMRGEDVVAAGVVYPEGEIMFSLWLGLPRRYLDAPPEAAMSALYWFGMRAAFEDGCRYFDFGGTRAFLNDGPYQFKRRWGPVVEDEFSPSSILIRPRASSKGAAFCSRVPVLKRTARGLEAVFVWPEEAADAASFARLEKEYGCAGIDRMTVIEISGGNETVRVPNEDGGCEYRIVRCPLARFVEHYVG